jgi:hypothetical protein
VRADALDQQHQERKYDALFQLRNFEYIFNAFEHDFSL